MNKLLSTICFYLIFILLASCERPDLTDDVEWAYYNPSSLCSYTTDCGDYNVYDCATSSEAWYAITYDTGEAVKIFYCDADGSCEQARQAMIDYCRNSSDSLTCTTIDGNKWSHISSNEKNWDEAVSYCSNLTECGYSDWHLPTISELRTLIQNCSATETGGSCGVTDSCLSYNDCWNAACSGCDYNYSGGHSKLGDTSWFWSSSTQSDDSGAAWGVLFSNGNVSSAASHMRHVRCVR